jgi:type III secretion protein W
MAEIFSAGFAPIARLPAHPSKVASDHIVIESLDAQVFDPTDLSAEMSDMADDALAAAAQFAARRAARRPLDLAASSLEGTEAENGDEADQAYAGNVRRIRTILAQGSDSWEAVYQLMRALFPDPADLAMLLAALRDDLGLDDEIRAQIDEALRGLADEQESLVRPGLNTAALVAAFAKRHRLSRQKLRHAYELFLLADADERAIYAHLIETFGFEQRGFALEFLEQAVAVDMSAHTPSRTIYDFLPLRALLARLRLLRCADSLLVADTRHHSAVRAAANAAANKPAARATVAAGASAAPDPLAHALVALLLAGLTDTHEAGSQFARNLRVWRAFVDPAELAAWTRDVLRAIARLPVEVFVDAAWREALLTALLQAADPLLDQHYRASYQQVVHG